MTDGRDVVEAAWPFEGPHSEDAVTSAAAGAEALTRYLANATYQPVRSGPALWLIVSRLGVAVHQLSHVIEHLTASASGAVADEPSLFDDRHDRPGADTAAEVAILLRGANAPLKRVAKSLADAASAASHLGNDEETARAVRRG